MSETNRHRWFTFFYRTRIKVWKNTTPIVNLSLAFTLLAAISAPWLAVASVVIALVLGYRFGIEKNAAGFSGDFDEVMRGAAQNVKNVVDSVVEKDEEP